MSIRGKSLLANSADLAAAAQVMRGCLSVWHEIASFWREITRRAPQRWVLSGGYPP